MPRVDLAEGRPILPAADEILTALEFSPSPGPGPGGWLAGGEPWWDLREAAKPLRTLLREKHLPPDALQGLAYKRVCFGDRERDRPADLTHARFQGSTFDQVVFVNLRLMDVSLRGCWFDSCDLRYVHTKGTSFQNAKFTDCDFYRAFFEAAVVFSEAKLTRVSLDKAWLAGVIGLTWEMFEDEAMVQESGEDGYARFLMATTSDRPPIHTRERALEERMLDVAAVYRALSGMWTIQGQLNYAGLAYVRCKTLERKYYSPFRQIAKNRRVAMRNHARKRLANADDSALDDRQRELKSTPKEKMGSIAPRNVGRWLALVIAWGVANFGESMRRVLICLALLILLPAAAFSLRGGVMTDGSDDEVRFLPRAILFSLEQLTASVHRMHSTNSIVDLVGAMQVFGGVTLLGLFGFTIANRLRNA